MKYLIRNATASDLDTVLTLNESVVPHVNSIALADMQDFLAMAVYFRVACDTDDQIVAFLIGLGPGIEYQSLNYRWFYNHYEHFAYVDRIAVAPAARRQRIAEVMYEDFAHCTRDWAKYMCCEVNLRPENPGSLAFHHRLGFVQIDTLESDNGAKMVALLLKETG